MSYCRAIAPRIRKEIYLMTGIYQKLGAQSYQRYPSSLCLSPCISFIVAIINFPPFFIKVGHKNRTVYQSIICDSNDAISRHTWRMPSYSFWLCNLLVSLCGLFIIAFLNQNAEQKHVSSDQDQSSMLKVICNQRDRFRARLRETEEVRLYFQILMIALIFLLLIPHVAG